MAYILAYVKNNEFKKVDLSLLSQFKKISKFKDCSYSLEEIDICTSLFEDEISFKRALYEQGAIDFDDITKELSIRRKNKGKLEKVTYGLVYSKEGKYLDIYYLRMVMLSLKDDRDFLNKLVSRYRDSYCNNINIARIRNMLINCNIDDNLYDALNDFYTREIFEIDRFTGEASIKYKPLHDLAMFVSNYVNNGKKGKNDKEEKNKTKKMLLELQKELLVSNKNTNYKKRVLKKGEVEGQISLFDEE